MPPTKIDPVELAKAYNAFTGKKIEEEGKDPTWDKDQWYREALVKEWENFAETGNFLALRRVFPPEQEHVCTIGNIVTATVEANLGVNTEIIHDHNPIIIDKLKQRLYIGRIIEENGEVKYNVTLRRPAFANDIAVFPGLGTDEERRRVGLQEAEQELQARHALYQDPADKINAALQAAGVDQKISYKPQEVPGQSNRYYAQPVGVTITPEQLRDFLIAADVAHPGGKFISIGDSKKPKLFETAVIDASYVNSKDLQSAGSLDAAVQLVNNGELNIRGGKGEDGRPRWYTSHVEDGVYVKINEIKTRNIVEGPDMGPNTLKPGIYVVNKGELEPCPKSQQEAMETIFVLSKVKTMPKAAPAPHHIPTYTDTSLPPPHLPRLPGSVTPSRFP